MCQCWHTASRELESPLPWELLDLQNRVISISWVGDPSLATESCIASAVLGSSEAIQIR